MAAWVSESTREKRQRVGQNSRRRILTDAADGDSFRSRVTGACVVNPTDAACIRLTGVGMEGKKSELASPAAESIRRNTPRGYSELQGVVLRAQESTLKSKVAYFLN